MGGQTGRGAGEPGGPGAPLSVHVWESWGCAAPGRLHLSLVNGDSPGVQPDWSVLRSPLFGLWPQRSVPVCVVVSDSVCALRPRPADVSRAVELLERLQRSGELPPQKLQALQRVLQSRFCSAIREVRAARRWSASGVGHRPSGPPYPAGGLRLPAAPGAARLEVPAHRLWGSLGVEVFSVPGLRGRGGSLGGRGCESGLLCRRQEGADDPLMLLRPRQVYEQLYDTLDITGSAEIRAHATAKVGAPSHRSWYPLNCRSS